MTVQGRRWLSTLARYAVCILAVTWLATHTDRAMLRLVIQKANWSLVAVSLLVFSPAPVILAIRLKWLLAVHEVEISTWEAVKVTFAGNFIIGTLPVGTPGGDAAKAYYIARDTPHKHEAVTTVFVDRVVGVVSLVLMAGLVSLVNWHEPAFARWGRLTATLLVAMLVGGTAYFSNRLRAWLRLDALLSCLPLSAHIRRVDRAVFRFRHRPRRVLAALMATVVLQLIAIVAIFLAGCALGLDGGSPLRAFPVYLGYVPVCFLAGALPLGVMEQTYIELFAKAAHLGTPEAALALSLLSRLIQLAWAMPGLAVVLKAGRPRPILEAPEDQAEAGMSGVS
jgi:glycosyltransferase 2 family protein